MGTWPLIYLGTQIGLSARRKIFWKPLIQKTRNKLASWKQETLNQVGWLSLIKSTINSLPVSWFSLNRVPKQVSIQLEGIKRNVFWGSLEDSNGQVKKNAPADLEKSL